MSEEKKLNGTVIVTYRCNARCSMCNRYKAPSKPEEEISIETIKKLPKMYFTNITGGEPFIRTDLKDIVRELYKKSDRIVISTNGFFTDRIVDLCKEFPQIGIRISIEGLEQTNNEIRGLQNGYQRGYGTLKKLREMGMKDVGFGMTVQDKNAPDLQYYDDEGLLRAKRSKENYRLYDENDMKKLWEILWYKEMGFQLREIKEIFAVPKKERNLYLEQRMKVIEGEIQNLEVQRKWVQYIEDCGMIEALPCDKKNQQNYLEQIKRIKRIHEDLSQLHMEEENEKSRKVELS